MTPYDPELTMEANARVLADELFSDGVRQEVSIWREKCLGEYLYAAFFHGWEEGMRSLNEP